MAWSFYSFSAPPTTPVPTCTSIGQPTSQSCDNSSCSQCGSCTCTAGAGWCTPGYQTFSSVNNEPIDQLPFTYTANDTSGDSCPIPGSGGTYTVNGGTTVCDEYKIPGREDQVLSWSNNKKLPTTITCKYFKPSANCCCTSRSCNCYAPSGDPPSC